jgi:hypothetical protein
MQGIAKRDILLLKSIIHVDARRAKLNDAKRLSLFRLVPC